MSTPVETIRIDADGPMDDDITRQIRHAIRRARKGVTTELLDGADCIAEIIPGGRTLNDRVVVDSGRGFLIEAVPDTEPGKRIPAVEGHGYLEAPVRKPTFAQELERVINAHSVESVSNTPDFILASFLNACLDAFNGCVVRRDSWYGVFLAPGNSHFPPEHYSHNPESATTEGVTGDDNRH